MESNMISRLGLEWCRLRLVGGHFLHEGKLMRLAEVHKTCVVAKELESNEYVTLPASVLTGFGVFRYPPLGYRKYGPGLAMWLSKTHSYARGLRTESITTTLSPVSTLLYRNYNRKMNGAFQPQGLMQLVFFPKYDSLDALELLYNGDVPCVVLNENLLIEANLANKDAQGYTIYFKQTPCATIDDAKRIHWHNRAYADALSQVFEQGG